MNSLIDIAQVGERLKKERERLGLSQEQCCELADITRPSQSRYETGASVPRLDYLARLGESGFDLCFVIFGIRSESFVEITEPRLFNEAIDFVDELSARHAFKPPPKFRIKSIVNVYYWLLGDRTHRDPPNLQDLIDLDDSC